jgi:integrase
MNLPKINLDWSIRTMVQSNCYATFQEIIEAYKTSAFWEALSEGSKIAYRKPLQRLLELSEYVNSSHTIGFAMQLPVAVARSRSLDRDEWSRAIRSLEVSNAEKNKMFIVLNRVYAGAGLPTMVFKQLPHEVEETAPYTSEEIEAIWVAVKNPATAFLRFCFWSGMRPWQEAVAMGWDQVMDGMVAVVSAKGREEGAVARCLNLLPQMQESLDFIKQFKPAPGNVGFVWIGETGRVLTKGSVAPRVKSACDAAGVPYRQMYDARRGLITEMLRNGYSLQEAADQAGHKSLETTRRYDQRTKAEKAQTFKGFKREERIDRTANLQ